MARARTRLWRFLRQFSSNARDVHQPRVAPRRIPSQNKGGLRGRHGHGHQSRPRAYRKLFTADATMTIVYIFERYPVLAQTFLRREVAALRAQGLRIEIHSLHKAGTHEHVEVNRKSTRLNSSHSQISYAVF